MTHSNKYMSSLSDPEIVEALLDRDIAVTTQYLYKQYLPMFSSIYNRYYTNCESVTELINEIYLFILYPNKDTGRCRLEDFGFRCSLPMWLKIVTENYCRYIFAHKIETTELNSPDGDRLISSGESINTVIGSTDTADIEMLLSLMPNERYRSIIKLRYVDQRTNEETAEALGMTMANFYNKHKLAKAQFCEALKKEHLI